VKISVVGQFSNNGLSSGAKGILESLNHAGIPSEKISLGNLKNDQSFSGARASQINFIVTTILFSDFIKDNFYKISPGKKYFYPLWELNYLPKGIVETLKAFDEVFAPSFFIKETLQNYLEKKINRIPHPVFIPEKNQDNKVRNGRLRFYSFLDMESHTSRKNPKGVLDAFQRAFPLHQKDVELIIKLRGKEPDGKNERGQIYERSFKDSRIKIVDRVLTNNEMRALMASANVFLSLHRSEGFGLGAAEALGMAKIVVATDYGGTRDFINHDTGFKVDYRLIPVQDFPYSENQLWADPDIDLASDILKSIYDHYDLALKRGLEGRIFMTQNHSFKSVGNYISNVLKKRML
jgi:glycosyltransferase involved in cell wall biosynthesis